MSTHKIGFYGEIRKIILYYHQIPTLSVPLTGLRYLNPESYTLTESGVTVKDLGWRWRHCLLQKVIIMKILPWPSTMCQKDEFNIL